MSILSIYYDARRSTPLTLEERKAMQAIERRFSVEDQVANFTGEGPNWESFTIYEPDQHAPPEVIFEGATGLPDNSVEHCGVGLARWCGALSEYRKVLHDAEWHVHVEDVDIPWNEHLQQWEPWDPFLTSA